MDYEKETIKFYYEKDFYPKYIVKMLTDTEYYKSNILETILKPHGDRIYPNKQWVFQLDIAPAHKANINPGIIRIRST